MQFNQCRSCDFPLAFEVGSDEACTFLCPNRYINFEGSRSEASQRNCALVQCPPELPFQSTSGSCFASEEEAASDYGKNLEEKNFRDTDNINNTFSTAPLAENGICPKNLPLLYSEKCFACDEALAVRTEAHCNIENDCENICPNRTILYWAGGNVPCVPNCPKDKPLMDAAGICFACDTPIPVGLEWNASLCERFCSGQRHLENDYCGLNSKGN